MSRPATALRFHKGMNFVLWGAKTLLHRVFAPLFLLRHLRNPFKKDQLFDREEKYRKI
jgi:hypothetical protein